MRKTSTSQGQATGGVGRMGATPHDQEVTWETWLQRLGRNTSRRLEFGQTRYHASPLARFWHNLSNRTYVSSSVPARCLPRALVYIILRIVTKHYIKYHQVVRLIWPVTLIRKRLAPLLRRVAASGGTVEFAVVIWDHSYSGWKLILELLTGYPNRCAYHYGIGGSFSTRAHASFQVTMMRLPEIGLEQSDFNPGKRPSHTRTAAHHLSRTTNDHDSRGSTVKIGLVISSVIEGQ